MVQSQLVLHHVGDGLCIGGGAGAAAPDGVVYLGQLVGYAVGDVGACGCTGVGSCLRCQHAFETDSRVCSAVDWKTLTENNTALECDRHAVVISSSLDIAAASRMDTGDPVASSRGLGP